MGIQQLYNDNLRKLPNEYGDVSVMFTSAFSKRQRRRGRGGGRLVKGLGYGYSFIAILISR